MILSTTLFILIIKKLKRSKKMKKFINKIMAYFNRSNKQETKEQEFDYYDSEVLGI